MMRLPIPRSKPAVSTCGRPPGGREPRRDARRAGSAPVEGAPGPFVVRWAHELLRRRRWHGVAFAARFDQAGTRECGELVWIRRARSSATGRRRSAPRPGGMAQQPVTSGVACRLCKLDHLLSPVPPLSDTGRAEATSGSDESGRSGRNVRGRPGSTRPRGRVPSTARVEGPAAARGEGRLHRRLRRSHPRRLAGRSHRRSTDGAHRPAPS